MADNDDVQNADDSPAPAEAPPPAPPPEQKPETEEEKARKDYETNLQNLQAHREHLDRMTDDARTRSDRMKSQLDSSLAELKGLVDQPAPAPPEGITMPSPLSEQQKGGLAEFVVNLLKFGALTTIAFGAGARNRGHGAAWKSAIGAALTGYANGRKDVTNAAMKVWEKNREIVNDMNREQNQNYRQLLQDRRLGLTQKMDMINALAKMYGDYRTSDATERQDLNATIKSIEAQLDVQRKHEDEVRKNRHKIYDAIGKTNINGQYFAWVHKKSGVNMDANWTADQYYEFTKEHPELHMSEFLKWHEQEEIAKAGKKAEATKRGSEAGKEPEAPSAEETEQEKKAAEDLKKQLGF
jgi:hypothetical protein